MGKKYIIELEDEPFCQEDGNFVYKVKGFNNIVFSMMDFGGLGTLTPYTEPDLEQVRKEEFKNGYDAACKDIDIKTKTNAAYQKGLDDLWEAMQKAIKMYCEIDNEVFLRVFYDVKCDWGESVLQALFKSTPKHLIDSIREYEERKTKVEYNFEEVKDVIETTAKEYNMSLDEIAAVLQKMSESE